MVTLCLDDLVVSFGALESQELVLKMGIIVLDKKLYFKVY